MRKLFVVLAKLVGFLLIYWTLANFMQVGFMIWVAAKEPDPAEAAKVLIGLAGILVYIALSFVMVWLFLAKTDWLANKLKIGADDMAGEVKEDAVLRVGVRLIGIYVTVFAVPTFVGALLELPESAGGWQALSTWSKILPTAIQLALGLVLTLKATAVVDRIAPPRRP